MLLLISYNALIFHLLNLNELFNTFIQNLMSINMQCWVLPLLSSLLLLYLRDLLLYSLLYSETNYSTQEEAGETNIFSWKESQKWDYLVTVTGQLGIPTLLSRPPLLNWFALCLYGSRFHSSCNATDNSWRFHDAGCLKLGARREYDGTTTSGGLFYWMMSPNLISNGNLAEPGYIVVRENVIILSVS